MQGSWRVAFKSKSAAFAQRFVIEGASSGDGIYAGDASTPAVQVTGSSWTINIQHNPGRGWTNSEMQFKFPVTSGGRYRVAIESDDSGGDLDFNDFVVECSTPVTVTDFVISGNVSCYSGRCLFNPCYPYPFLAIESADALRDALQRPILRKPIERLYPEYVFKLPQPLPGPPPFRALVIPLEGQAALPPKRVQILQVREASAAKAEFDNGEEAPAATVSTARIATLSEAKLTAGLAIETLALGRLNDRLKLFCNTRALAGTAIRFQEYDRTSTELGGGAYTGTGGRETLGTTITDRNGNYVFRFSRSLNDFLSDAFGDTGTGESLFVQAMPDVIAQILDPITPSGISYESSPYWNVPLLKRINVCVHCAVVPSPVVCPEGLIIQRVGNITMGFLNADGTRTTPGSFLGAEGRITNTPPLGPGVQCAAWAGRLQLWACLKNPDIRFYTIRYKKPGAPATDWKFAKDDLALPRVDAGPPSAVIDAPVGRTQRSLEVDGVMQTVDSYRNVETAVGENWLSSWVNLKIVLNSKLYEDEAGGPGPMMFRIEGYRADGTKFAGADDAVTLYLDNSTPDLFINPNITMINTGIPPGAPGHEVTLGDCALFTLPTASAPLRVRFRANQLNGFMNSYELYMQKGSTGNFAVSPPPPSTSPFRTRAYVHDNLNCDAFSGTSDDPAYDDVGTETVSVNLIPIAASGWLEPDQIFCAFAVRLTASVRVTNGQGVFGPYNEPVQILIGIKKEDVV